MNDAFSWIRLVLYFIIADISKWNLWAIIAIIITEISWVIEYDLLVKELDKKHDKATKRNSTVQKGNPKIGEGQTIDGNTPKQG